MIFFFFKIKYNNKLKNKLNLKKNKNLCVRYRMIHIQVHGQVVRNASVKVRFFKCLLLNVIGCRNNGKFSPN